MWCVEFWQNGEWVGNSLLKSKPGLPLDGTFLTPPATINGNILAQIARSISNFSWFVKIDTQKNKVVAIASMVETANTGLGPRHFSENPELVAWLLFRQRDPNTRAYWATYSNIRSRGITAIDLIETIPSYSENTIFDKMALEKRCKQLAETFEVPIESVTHWERVRRKDNETNSKNNSY